MLRQYRGVTMSRRGGISNNLWTAWDISKEEHLAADRTITFKFCLFPIRPELTVDKHARYGRERVINVFESRHPAQQVIQTLSHC